MADFRDNLKLVMAPYKVGAMPKYLKTTGDAKKLEDSWGNNEVKASALRDVIEEKTGGRVKVTDSIDNENSLLGILRSYMRMKNYENGNLVPDNVTIFDPDPSTVKIFGGGLAGEYWDHGGTKKTRDPIAILDTSLTTGEPQKLDTSENRFHPTTGDTVERAAVHELAHGAQYAYDNMPQRYVQRVKEDAKKYENKYGAGDILVKAISDVVYAVPKLFDTVFGTHIVPTEEEWWDMEDGFASNFWANNFKTLGDKDYGVSYDSVGHDMQQAASKKSNSIDIDRPRNLFEQAAKNTGFSSVDEANRSISRYADWNWTEAFAEAYSDVLLNGDQAKPYSKELIRLYSEAADKWAKEFRSDEMPMQVDMLKKLMDVSPLKNNLSIKK